MSALVALLVALAVGVPGAADAIDVDALIEDERAWIAAGAHVYVVTGAVTEGRPAPVPAQVCDRLAKVDGVDAAFALVHSDSTATVAHVPGGGATVYNVSAGAARFLDASAVPGPMLLVTSGFADRTGVRDDDLVTALTRTGDATASLVSAPLSVRVVSTAVIGEAFDGALLVPVSLPEGADACYVRTDAAHHAAVEQLLPVYLATGDRQAVVQPRLFRGEFTVDYTNAYEKRPLRWVWVPGAVLLGLVWAMLQWFRRPQVAVYATFGMRASSRMIMQTAEWAALGGIGLVWGWSLGVLGALALGAEPGRVLVQVGLHAVLTVLAATGIVVILGTRPTGNLLTAVKDR